MHAENAPASVSKAAYWIGMLLSVVPALLLLFDGGMKIAKPPFVVEQSAQAGFGEHVLVPLGVVLCLSAVLYLVPRTAVLGAILLTGYLGGAVATHVILGDPLFQVLFPATFGAVLWLGLVLRDRGLRRVVFGGR